MNPVELPTVAPAPTPSGPAPSISRERYEELARRARLLSWFSLGWMTVEGAVAILAGIAASSIALAGFGIDSAIEGIASLIIIWRFTGSRLASEAAEERAQKLVAITFFLLAPYIAVESLRDLIGGHHPEASWVGIALAAVSLVLMPLLGLAKQRIGKEIGSAATAGEGSQNLLCAYMAGALLVGLLGNALLGAWWLDPAAALVIAALALNEGVESWQGESCGCIPAAGGGGASCEKSCS